MAVLTTKQRAALPGSAFALPGGRYPIENASHARKGTGIIKPKKKPKLRIGRQVYGIDKPIKPKLRIGRKTYDMK